MSDLKLNAMIPSDDMKPEALTQLLQSKGLASYGTKTEIVDRYKKSLMQEARLSYMTHVKLL